MDKFFKYKIGDEVAIISSKSRKVVAEGVLESIEFKYYKSYKFTFKNKTSKVIKLGAGKKGVEFLIVKKEEYNQYLQMQLLKDFMSVIAVDTKCNVLELSVETGCEIIEHLKAIKALLGDTSKNEEMQKMYGNHSYTLKEIKNQNVQELAHIFNLEEKMSLHANRLIEGQKKEV